MKATTVYRSIFSLTLAWGLILAAAPGRAGETEEAPRSEELIVSAARVDKELLDVPMSVGVLTAGEIEKSSSVTVGELLRDVTGVKLQTSGAQGLNRVSIRGEDPHRTLILIDGQKISDQKNMDGVPILIDPSAIERVEVIKGPASVLYGSEAMGGVINIITKKGSDKPLELQASLGFNGATGGFTENLSLWGGARGFKYRLSASNSDQPELRTPEGIAENSEFEQRSVSGFLSYDISEKLSAGFSYDLFRSEIMAGSYELPNFFVDMKPWKRQKAAVFMEAKNISSWLPRLRFDAFWQTVDKYMHNHVPAAAAIIMDNYAYNEGRQLGLSLQADWALGDRHYLITGYELINDSLDSSGRTDLALSMGPALGLNSRTDSLYQGQMDTHALFAQMESTLPSDFILTYGVRQTWVKSRMDKADGVETRTMIMGGRPLGSTVSAAAVGTVAESSEAQPVFNVSLLWRGLEDLSLRAGWSQGFRVASLADRYVSSSMGGGTVLPNPELDPEYSNNWELGLRYSSGGLNLDTALFYSQARDYITSKIIDAATDTVQNINVGKARSYGLELTFSYDLDCGLTPYLSASWLRRRFDYGSFSTYNSGSPEFSGRLGLRGSHELNSELELTTDFYGRFASANEMDSYDESGGTVKKTRYQGWATANAAIGLNFGPEKRYCLNAELLNIFDKKYSLGGAIYEPGVHATVKFGVKF